MSGASRFGIASSSAMGQPIVAELGIPSGTGHVSRASCAELFAMVTILGQSRRPAFRFALDRTRDTTFSRVVQCCADLGGMTREMLTDRDPAFCIGSTSDGRAILAPEWVDLAALLGVVPRA